ncbi:MAG: twin-arginine translocase subunit TatC [Proteobacteria bacterium]|nr:twin-arginine translocase subunit TatC [Pseudomonadota bacterium]
MEDQKTKNSLANGGTMGFIDHLEELRTRLLRFTVVMVLCILATYAYRKEILDLVRKPVDEPLKKYTSASNLEKTSTKQQLPLLSQYDCSCQPVLKREVFQEQEEFIPPKAEKKEAPKIITEPDRMQGWSDKIKSTFNDFLVFYQVLTGREPEPMGKVVSNRGSVNKKNARKSLPDEMQLSCSCFVKSEYQEAQGKGANMVYIGLPELFFAQMKVAIFAGFFLAFPYLLIEIWGFVGPALYKSERKIYWIFSICSVVFFIGGALFGYFVVFPYGFDFFLSLSQPGKIMPSLSIGDFLSFSLKLLMAFGAIFEMPLIVFILARLGVLTPEMMIKQARVAVLIVFILSAVLTPPDPFTMMLMAGPLVLLYIFSIGVCFVAVNRKKAAQRAQGIEWDDDDDLE